MNLGETLDAILAALLTDPAFPVTYLLESEENGTRHVVILERRGERVIGRGSTMGRAITRAARRGRRLYNQSADLPPLPDPTLEED
jgi:hypothetical protein